MVSLASPSSRSGRVYTICTGCNAVVLARWPFTGACSEGSEHTCIIMVYTVVVNKAIVSWDYLATWSLGNLASSIQERLYSIILTDCHVRKEQPQLLLYTDRLSVVTGLKTLLYRKTIASACRRPNLNLGRKSGKTNTPHDKGMNALPGPSLL